MTTRNFEVKITVAIFLVTVALSACSGNSANSANVGVDANNAGSGNTGNSTNSNGAAKNEYPQEVREAFLQSCQSAGSKLEICSCVLDKMQHQYTFEEFSVIETKMRAGRTPDEFLEFSGKARAECMK